MQEEVGTLEKRIEEPWNRESGKLTVEKTGTPEQRKWEPGSRGCCNHVTEEVGSWE